MRYLLLASVAVLGACGSNAAGLEVIVEADLEVANRSTRVAFEVRTQEGEVALQETFNIEQTPFPIRRLVGPRGGDATRVVTITVQAVNANGDTLTTARIIRSFVEGRTVEIRLRLYELCLGTNCPEGLTCEPINGRAECVDARVIDNTSDGGVDGDAASMCPEGQLLCGDQCVDAQSDESHCGTCGNVCPSEQVCSNGRCEIVPCDAPTDCAQGSYCNPNVGRCLSGCDEPSDCGDNATCNLSSNQCECASGYHQCSSGCLPDNAVTSCGDRCSPCEGTSNATASCQASADTFVCASSCNDGFKLCNGRCALATSPTSCGTSCAVCPGSSRGTAICNAGTCSLLCNQGKTLCPATSGQDCVDTTSDLDNCGMCGRVCSDGQVCQSSNCIDPPNCDANNPASCTGLTYCNPSNNRCAPGCDPRLSNQCGSNQTCSANQCVCVAGTHDCGGVCVSNGSVNSCGTTSCTPCALVANASQMGCNGTSCTVISCMSGYQRSSDQRSCVDINECFFANGECHVNATCNNIPGTRTCTCNPGFAGTGMMCSPTTPVWRQLAITGPTGRGDHSMVYDSASDRVVMFGGLARNDFGTYNLGDTWILSDSAWSQMTGPGPVERFGHRMVYDSAMNRVVLFGGHNTNSGRLGDTWVLSGSTWSQIMGPGPPARVYHAMAYDSELNRVVLFGGHSGSTFLNDTWVLSGTTWNQIGGPRPTPRDYHSLVYDSALDRTVLFGGFYNGTYLGDTWILSQNTWAQIASPGPLARGGHGMAYDSARSRMVLFGGGSSTRSPNDTWTLNGTTWTDIAGPGPSSRDYPAMAYDSASDRVLLFGGQFSVERLSDTWSFE